MFAHFRQTNRPLKPIQKIILLSCHLLCFSSIVNCHFFILFDSICQFWRTLFISPSEFLSLDALKIVIPSAPLRDVLDYACLCASFSCQGKRHQETKISSFPHLAISPCRVLNTPRSRFSAWQYHVTGHVLSSTHRIQLRLCYVVSKNRSVAKVSFKMFSHLSGMLMLQKRQRPTMFLFWYRPHFNEKSRCLEFVAGKHSSIRRTPTQR